MRFRHRNDGPVDLDSGASYRRNWCFDIVETAKIVAVRKDALGITHVRFNLSIAGSRSVTEDQRTLSLESFRRIYSEQVVAGA